MRQSQLDKAIERLEMERNILDLAIAKLRAQQVGPAKKAYPDVSRMPMKRRRRPNGPETEPVGGEEK